MDETLRACEACGASGRAFDGGTGALFWEVGMVKLFSTYFPNRTVFVAVSETLIVFTLLLAAALVDPARPRGVTPANGLELLRIGMAGLVCLACFYYQDLYKPGLANESYAVFGHLFRALGVASVALAVLYVLFPAAELNSAILGIWLVGVGSGVIHYGFLALNNSNRWRESTALIGDGPLALEVMHIIQSQSELGLNLVGYFGERLRSTSARNVPYLGPAKNLPEAFKDVPIGRIIVAMPDRRAKLPVDALLDLRLARVAVQDGTEFCEATTGRILIGNLQPSWLLFGAGFRVSRLQTLSRRCISLAISLLIFLACLPLVPFISIAIKLTSPGPILFRQERVGRNGKRFGLYKFRTMHEHAEANTGPVWASKQDPRVTGVGKFLRATRLDELPQLWNVMAGDMALVGPRPERPEFVSWLSQSIPYYNMRHLIEPGLTGWAQVCYRYGASFEESVEKLQYDLFYIKHMSLSLDLLIVLKTIKVVFAAMGS